MPLNVQDQLSTPKITVFFSRTVEFISVLSMLADTKHHEYARPLFTRLLMNLSSRSLEALKLVAALPYHGIELVELVLDSRAFTDIDSFIYKFQNYKDEYFVYYLSGGSLELDQIRSTMRNKENFEDFIMGLPWLVRDNTAVFSHILYRTEDFKHQLIELFQELNHEPFGELIDSLQGEYAEAVQRLQSGLTAKPAAEVVSAILNRKIDEDAGVREYIFVPSYFVSPHYILISNQYARLAIFDMRAGSHSNRENEGQKLASSLNVISDKTRLELLRLIILQPAYGKLLAARLNLTTATISHHIEQLKKYSLVTESRNKNTKYFSANIEEIDKLLDGLKDYLYNR
jgi:DNA-binding transcriptional ArsR family regulator